MKAIDHLKAMKVAKIKEQYPSLPDRAIPIPKYTDNSANALTKCICDFLNMSGYQAERINTMGRMLDNRKTYTDVIGRQKTIGSTKYIPTTGTKGSADISATIAGRSVKIEVKYGKDRQSDEQKAYQEQIEKAGGTYYIARDFQSFYDWFQEFVIIK
jgi:hypothetical protein